VTRDYRGRDDVLGFFREFMKLSGGAVRLQLDDILAKGDTVVALVTESAQRGGRTWSSPQVHVWTLEHGRATRFWQYQGDQQAEDEFWSLAA
jgi:ketosteroid isomerase-like protein